MSIMKSGPKNDMNKSAAMKNIETLKKDKKKYLFQYCSGKILLNKEHNCVLCEKPNKVFCC